MANPNERQLLLDKFIAYHTANTPAFADIVSGLTLEDCNFANEVTVEYDYSGKSGNNSVTGLTLLDGTYTVKAQTFTPRDLHADTVLDDSLNPNFASIYADQAAFTDAIDALEITEPGVYCYYDADGTTVKRAGLVTDETDEAALAIIAKVQEYLTYDLSNVTYEYLNSGTEELQLVIKGECIGGVLDLYTVSSEVPEGDLGEL